MTGSFIILSTVSYAIPFLANVITGRKYFPKGPFHLGRYGTAINITDVLFISMFNVLYCFRMFYPHPISRTSWEEAFINKTYQHSPNRSLLNL